MTEQRPFLDLTRHQWVREVGDLTIFGTWVPLPDDADASEPAIAIVPRYRAIAMPVVIALSAAYRYDNPRYAACRSMEFAADLGMEPTPSNALKVFNLINDHLSDLISMPPEPRSAVAVADATVTIDGKSRNLEVLQHVPSR